MNNIQDLIFEFNSILDFVKKQAESGLEEFIALEERLSSFGENLNNFFISSIEEIDRLKKELTAQKLEADEIIAKLNKKLEALSGTLTDGDYKLCSIACKKDYEQCWDLLEEDSKKFLITSYFIFKKISTTNSDFSSVVLCLCKPFENEIMKKIFIPFIIEESKLPIITVDTSKLRETIERYKNTNHLFLYIKIMLSNFRPPKHNNGYTQRLHNKLYKNSWNMRRLVYEPFIAGSIEYMEKYRNTAAHIDIMEEQSATACKLETIKYVTHFLSAYPKSK